MGEIEGEKNQQPGEYDDYSTQLGGDSTKNSVGIKEVSLRNNVCWSGYWICWDVIIWLAENRRKEADSEDK